MFNNKMPTGDDRLEVTIPEAQELQEVDSIEEVTLSLKNLINELQEKGLTEEERNEKEKQAGILAEKIRQQINKVNINTSITESETNKKIEDAKSILNSYNQLQNLKSNIKFDSGDETTNQGQTKESENKGQEPDQEEKGFFGKTGKRIGNQRSDIWSGDKRKEQPGQNILRLVGFGGGTIAAGYGIYKLRERAFGKKKKEKEGNGGDSNSGENEEKKGFWDRWYGKVLKWTGIGTGIYYISNGLITGDWSIFGWNPFSKEKKDGVSTTPGSDIEISEKAYEKLSQEDKQIYESSANAINEYQGNIMGDTNGSKEVEDLMGDSEFDKDKIGLLPFMLSNRYDSLNKMLSETSLYYEIIGKEGHIAWNKIKDWGSLNEAKDRGLDNLKMLLTPLVGVVNGLTLDLLNLDEGWDKLIENLKSIDGLEEKLGTIFRKSITVMSYYQSRKGALEYKLAEQELIKSDPDSSNLSDEDKIEIISEHLQDEEWYKQHIESEVSEFMNLNLKNATKYLQEKGLLNGELDPSVNLVMDKVEERRKELLNIDDEDDASILQDMKAELNNGRLSEKAQKKLKNICEDFEEEIYSKGRQHWYTKYLPMLQVFDGGEQLMNDIQKCGDYENIANKYKDQIDSILKKSKDGTLQESDLDLLEETINDYYKFQKSLVSTEINISKSVDERGNIVYRRGRAIRAGGQNIRDGVQIVMENKEGSNVEGVGLIAGGILSVDALTIGLAGKKVIGYSPFLALNKEVVFPIARQGLKLTGKGIERLTGNMMRANLGGIAPASFYTEDTLKIAIANGDITLDKAVKIAKKNRFKLGSGPNVPVINTKEDLIKRILNLSDDNSKKLVKVIENFGDNPNIYKKLMKGFYDSNGSSKLNPTDRFHLDPSKKIFEIDEIALTKLENIAVRVENMSEGTEKKVMQSMMRYIKDFDQVEDFAIMGVGDDMVKLLEKGDFIKPEKYGKYLANYVGKIDADDMRAFEKFIIDAKNNGKIGKNTGLFIRNSMKNFANIKKRGFAIDKIDDLALNSSRWSKLLESTKINCNKMINHIEGMINNPKFKPFHQNMKKCIDAIKNYSETLTEEGMKAMKNMSIFGKESVFSKLDSEGMLELSKLRNLLRNGDIAKDLSKALKGTKTLDEIKDTLKNYGIAVDKINDEVLLKIAKTGDIKKIKDIVNYGAEFKTIQGLKKLMSNPAFKQAGRVGGKALIGLDFLFVGYNFYSSYDEAQKIKQYNLERGERKEGQSYFELGTGGLGAVSGVCMFIPGAGWIAGGLLAISMGAMEIGNKYYEDINKFKQNQSDFLAKGIAATKQELISIDSRDQGLSHTWIDAINLGGSETEKKIGTPKTKTEALKALIRMEELQKNPLAGVDSNDPEAINNQELAESIRQAKQQLEETVQKRFEYFKINYIDKKKPIIEKTNFENNQAFASVELALELSSIYVVMDRDTGYTGEKTPEKYKEEKLKELKNQNEGNFNRLEKLLKENPNLLFQMYAELPYYRPMLSQYGGEDQSKFLDSCDYFEQYMVYKLLGKPISSYPNIKINPDDIDYNQIHNFMSNYTIVPTLLDENESKNYKGLSDEEILERYGISGILGQDILFECAKLLDYNGKNSLDDLKQFFDESKKEINGIYYNGNDWVINENNGSDDEFAKDSNLNSITTIKKMRKYINDNVNGSFLHGSMFTESSSINKEIGNKIIKIIDDYLLLRKGNVDSKIEEYVKNNSSGRYIALPTDLVIELRKTGLKGVGSYLYKYENGEVEKKENI